jgi:hypothetical protein
MKDAEMQLNRRTKQDRNVYKEEREVTKRIMSRKGK